MKTNRHIICVVYDPLIEKNLGTKPAQAFDWLYSFIHLREAAGTMRDGRKWVKFTYKQLEECSNALPNAYAWRRALEKLEKWGLVISEESEKKDGKWYAINFFAVRALIGHAEFGNGYELDMKNQQTPNWITPYVKPEPKQVEPLSETLAPSEQNEQAELEQDAQPPLSNLSRPHEQDAQTSIYRIDSSFDTKDSTSPNGDGVTADLPSSEEFELEAPKNVFQAIGRILYPGLVLDEDMRKTIQRVIGTIQNTQIYVGAGKKEKPLLDPQIVEDYGIWRMLISESGVSGFPAVQEFLDEFRFQFFKWYWTASNRTPLQQIKSEFSDWRTRLYTGDYVAFRRDVQARVMRTAVPTRPTGGKGGSPLARTPEQLEKAWGRRSPDEKKDER